MKATKITKAAALTLDKTHSKKKREKNAGKKNAVKKKPLRNMESKITKTLKEMSACWGIREYMLTHNKIKKRTFNFRE